MNIEQISFNQGFKTDTCADSGIGSVGRYCYWYFTLLEIIIIWSINYKFRPKRVGAWRIRIGVSLLESTVLRRHVPVKETFEFTMIHGATMVISRVTHSMVINIILAGNYQTWFHNYHKFSEGAHVGLWKFNLEKQSYFQWSALPSAQLYLLLQGMSSKSHFCSESYINKYIRIIRVYNRLVFGVPCGNHYHILVLDVRSFCHHLNNYSLLGVDVVKVIDDPRITILNIATTDWRAI